MMTQNINPEPEDLRTEYQVCQQAANGQSSSYWAFAGIFLGLSTAGFGLIVPNIFSIPITGFKIFVTFISVGMIAIYWILDFYLSRINTRNRLLHDRMREIETKRGMEAQHQQKGLKGVSGMCYWRMIIITLSILWILAIILTWSCQST